MRHRSIAALFSVAVLTFGAVGSLASASSDVNFAPATINQADSTITASRYAEWVAAGAAFVAATAKAVQFTTGFVAAAAEVSSSSSSSSGGAQWMAQTAHTNFDH